MSSDGGPLWLLPILFLCVLNALVAASMRALDYVDSSKLREQCEDVPGDRRAETVLRLTKRPSAYHYADLVVSYACLIAVWLLSALAIGSTLDPPVRVLARLVFILLYIALADILPKKLAAQAADETALRMAAFQQGIDILFLPLTKLCVLIANLILRLLHKKTDVDDPHFSEERVLSMLDKGQETGDIKEEGRKMIDSIFAFDDLLAYEIMTPRTDVFMIDLEDDKEKYFDQIMDLRYSRIPVCDGDADNIVGVLHIKDYLLQASLEGFDNIRISEIMRSPYFVPETKNIDELFVELQRRKQQLALLIDEYGGFSGLVSLEDIIEQIVGDIDDEFDEEERIIQRISETEYVVDGDVYLDDLDEETGISLESEDSETVGGFLSDLIAEQTGESPNESDIRRAIPYERYCFRILELKDRRIEKLRIDIQAVSAADAVTDGTDTKEA